VLEHIGRSDTLYTNAQIQGKSSGVVGCENVWRIL